MEKIRQKEKKIPRLKKMKSPKKKFYLLVSATDYKYGVFPRTPDGLKAAENHKKLLETQNREKYFIK